MWPGGDPVDGCTVVQSLEELSAELKKYDTDDVYIIGGAMMYRTMLPYCNEAYITKVDADGGAEVFFENLDETDGWTLAEAGEAIPDNGYTIRFTVYKNSAARVF